MNVSLSISSRLMELGPKADDDLEIDGLGPKSDNDLISDNSYHTVGKQATVSMPHLICIQTYSLSLNDVHEQLFFEIRHAKIVKYHNNHNLKKQLVAVMLI